jgi:2-oxoisovalerate dehydrogenase E1 component alpha subunit
MLRFRRLTSRTAGLKSSNPQVAFYSSVGKFPGAPTSTFTSSLNFQKDYPIIPTFRILSQDGILLGKEPEIDDKILIKMYKDMITLNQMDLIMYESSIEEAPDDTVLKTSTQRH